MSPDRGYDVIAVGVGAMGSAACRHLARRGKKVLGLERFDIPHAMGSSHGVTRIIRMAYFEDPSYVPLLARSYRLWRELEEEAGERLLVITGGIDAAPEDHQVFQGSLDSCRAHGLEHEVLTGREVGDRFPGYRIPEDHMAVYQPDGGYLLSERCVVAQVAMAQRDGAEIHAREQVLGWDADDQSVRVRTDRSEYRAKQLVFAAGPWSGEVLDFLAQLAKPERQVLAWFQPVRPELFSPDRFPIFNLEVEEGHFYGFPIESIPGFKVGRYHHLGEEVDPDQMDREPRWEDEALLRGFTERYFPDAAGPTMTLKACLFTNSPDEHFIIDRHPATDRVVVAAGFSGHGFKFASVVGEILADLVVDGETRHDIELLRLDRFAGRPEREAQTIVSPPETEST